MVSFHFAKCTDATRAWTWVAASETDARPVRSAFVIDATFVVSAASDAGRIATQTFRAATQAVTVGGDDALRVRSAWIRLAWRPGLFTASNVRIAIVTSTAEALFAVIRHVAVGVRAARSWTTQLGNDRRQIALAERIADVAFGTEANRISRDIARGTVAAGIRFAWVSRLDAASDGVRTLDVAVQACALGETIAKSCALCVRTAWRWIAWIGRYLARCERWRSIEFWQAEALWRIVDDAAATVRSTRVRMALVSFWNCISEMENG